MEVDLLFDVGAESLNCCSGWMEYTIEKGLSTKNGRMTLIITKVIGLLFDILAIILFTNGPSEQKCEEECIENSEHSWAEDDCVDNCMGGANVRSIGVCFIILFILDRVLVIPLMLIYGCNPSVNKKYQAWLDTYTTQNEKINSKYGLTSLWYGSLFNFPDYAAKLWSIDTDVICGSIGCTYISFIFIEGFTLLLFVVFGFTNFFFADKAYQRKNWYRNMVLAINSIAVGFGVIQHYMNIAYTLRNKTHHKSSVDKSSKTRKHVQPQQQQPVIYQQQPQQPQPQPQMMMAQMPDGQMVMVQTMPSVQQPYGYPQPHVQTQPQPQGVQPVVAQNTQTNIPMDNNDDERPQAVTCGDRCLYSCGSCCFYFCLLFAGCYGLTFFGMTIQALVWMCLAFV